MAAKKTPKKKAPRRRSKPSGSLVRRELSTTVEPWERQPWESQVTFKSFTVYRDLDARSVPKVAAIVGKSKSSLRAQSSAYRWVERCNAYEAHLDRLTVLTREEEIVAMTRRHLGLASAMQVIGGHALSKLTKAIAKGETVTLSLSEARMLVDSGARMERLNRGQPGEIVEVEKLTDEQLLKLSKGASIGRALST